MKRVGMIALLLSLSACTAGSSAAPPSTSSPSSSAPIRPVGEEGKIQAVFFVGDRYLSDARWVEMIQLTGPRGQRCDPGDCGLTAGALREGAEWPPGRWRVVPPHVDGWTAAPALITVAKGRMTTFYIRYDAA